jgi:membrane glycosyltransferase
MTREELRTNQEYMWQALSGEQSMTLTLAVEMLLPSHLSPYQILTKTMTALEGLQHDS